jgi:hypothetical protein
VWGRAKLRAQDEWIREQCQCLYDGTTSKGINGGAAWEAFKTIKTGLSRMKKARPMKLQKNTPHDGTFCTTAAENVKRMEQHMEGTYGRNPTGKPGVEEEIPQHDVFEGHDGLPSDEDFDKAVNGLRISGPGNSGVHAAGVKALLETEETREVLKQLVFKFWITGVMPTADEVDWELGRLKLLPKGGDLGQPKQWRGIMMLECTYKVVANILKVRLNAISEQLDHESQCGFRARRGCPDAKMNVRLAVLKRREHGLETWVFLLDIVKAFDRVPRELLWKIMARLGVPAKLIDLLKALHANVKVRFELEGEDTIVVSTVGVKQGDILGPILYLFHGIGMMMVWRARCGKDRCVYRTKFDDVLTGRRWKTGGNSGRSCLVFEITDSIYADDTADFYCSRKDVDKWVPLLYQCFDDFGLEVHRRAPGDNGDSKSAVLFCAAPRSCYTNPDTYDAELREDPSDDDYFSLDPVVVDGAGSTITIVDNVKYLGGILTTDAKDDKDVDTRIKKANGAFGGLRKCFFANQSISLDTKRIVYLTVIVSILLFGSETWVLTEELHRQLECFHNQCVRVMCGVTYWRQWQQHIRADTLLERLQLTQMRELTYQRQLRWLGHVRRMSEDRLPRRLLTSWVYHPRASGGQMMNYGRSVQKALYWAGVEQDEWFDLSQERAAWGKATNRQ